MKLSFLLLLVAACPLSLTAQSTGKKPQLPPHPNAPASEPVQTEQIVAPNQPPPSSSAKTDAQGHLESEQTKVLTHKIWLAEFRLNDLLSQVRSDKWKMAPSARQSFDDTMASTHKALDSVESWRGQFEARPDSLYLGFMTYVSLGAVLPRVDGVGQSVSKYENNSFGAQFSQAGNQLFDLQQMIEPQLAVLLKSQDSVLLISQNNLASCQNELNFAEHDKEGHAIPMRNIAPAFKGHGKASHTNSTPPSATADKSKSPVTARPTANSTQKPQKN